MLKTGFMKNLRIAILLIGLTPLLIHCKKDDDTTEEPIDDTSTYSSIQTRIWDQQCIGCHISGSSFATQSDLVLTAGSSYDQLVNRAPNNAAALEDGLELVGTDGLESLYKSFLWEKINANDLEHFYSDHPFYGAIMPLGGEFLTNGELEFIRQWIINGAPEEGVVADLSLLEDESRYEASDFEALPPPEQGYQFHLGPFDVKANEDRELFYYEPLDNAEEIFINQVEISMAPGSHHFIFYTFDESLPTTITPEDRVIRDLYDESGNEIFLNLLPLQYHIFVSGTQWPTMNYHFPEGVALRLPANTGLDLNSHYANGSNEVIQGEVYGNLHTVPASEVVHVAENLQLNNQNLFLPAGQVTTVERTYWFNEKRYIFQLFSHAHEHMTDFRVYVEGGDRDGELVYISLDWEHPPILELDPPLEINQGEGLRLEVTYDNYEDRDLGFGLRSTDEMMILFGAYYTD